MLAPADSIELLLKFTALGIGLAVVYTPLLKQLALGDLVIYIAFG